MKILEVIPKLLECLIFGSLPADRQGHSITIRRTFVGQLLSLAVSFVFCSSLVFAEAIKLKSGAVFEGEIVELTDTHVVINRGNNQRHRIKLNFIDENSLAVLNSLPKSSSLKESSPQEGDPSSTDLIEKSPFRDDNSSQDDSFYSEVSQSTEMIQEESSTGIEDTSLEVDTENLNQPIMPSPSAIEPVQPLVVSDSEAQETSVSSVNDLSETDLPLESARGDLILKTMLPYLPLILGSLFIVIMLAVIINLVRKGQSHQKLVALKSSGTDATSSVAMSDPSTQDTALVTSPSVEESQLIQTVVPSENISTLKPIHFNFIKPGPNKRVCAYLIDCYVAGLLVFGAQSIKLGVYSNFVPMLYFLLKDALTGQSIGKLLVGLWVIHQKTHLRIRLMQGIKRNLFWVVASFVSVVNQSLVLAVAVVPLVEYVFMLLDKDGQRLGDKLAHSKVHDLRPQVKDKVFLLISLLLIAVPVCLMVLSLKPWLSTQR